MDESKQEVMSPEEFRVEMEALASSAVDDPETVHKEAVALICRVLRQLGYEEGVEVFEEMTKWSGDG